MRYFLQRLFQFVVVFVIVTFFVMVMMRLGLDAPGDPARTMLGGTPPEALIVETTEKYHLDSNYFVQYWYWITGMLTGDMGYSVPNSLPVAELMQGRVMTTLFIGIYTIIFALLIAIPVGVRAAYRRDGVFDRTTTNLAFMFVSVPTIVMAVVVKLIFIDNLGWFPRVGDKVYLWQDPVLHFKNFFLPVLALTLPLSAIFSRLLRGEMVMTLQSDFIILASAKGVAPRRVLWGHALRNSVLALMTAVGTNLGALIGGALVVEVFFDLDGMGSMLVVAIFQRDLFTVQATSAVLVATVVVANLVVDLMYPVVDPRIRQARALG